MSTDFQSTLKALGKQAKKEAEARAEEAATARRRDEDNIDFAKAVSGVTPLKDSRRYEAPRDRSPIKPRPKEAGALAEEDYFYVGSGGCDEPPASFSKNGQGKNDIQRLRNGERIYRVHQKTRRVRRNHPRQRFGFGRLQTGFKKYDATMADAASRRIGVCRTEGGQRRSGQDSTQAQP